jgi:hypothetical protein
MWQTLIRVRQIWSEKRRALLSRTTFTWSVLIYPDVKWSLLLLERRILFRIRSITKGFILVADPVTVSLIRLQFRWSIDVFPFWTLHLSACCSEVRTSIRRRSCKSKLVTGLCSDKHIGHARQRRRDRNLYVSDEKNSNAYLVFCRKARAIEERNARPDGLLSA